MKIKNTDDLTYEEFIATILANRSRFINNECVERHHILPKCMGGNNTEENLIDLYGREHFIAHKLLAKENPTNNKLVYAWWCMAHLSKTNDGRECTPEEYEEARAEFRKLKPHKGIKHSEETKKLIGSKSVNRKWHKGFTLSKEVKEKISKSKKGTVSWNKGKSMTEEQRISLSKLKKIPIIQYDKQFNFIKEWDSAQDAYIALQIDPSSISRCCKGKVKTAGGFIWKYKEKGKEEK